MTKPTSAGAHERLTPRVVMEVDGSPKSQAALCWAVGHDHRVKSRVHAVTVCSAPAG